MAKDFATKTRSRSASRAQPRSQVPGWVWLFTGTILGGFIMFLIHLSDVPAGGQVPEQTAETTPTEPAEREQPRFDFYKLLKESKVPLPEVEPEQPAEVAAEPEQYILQVASFKGADDAEQLRAELILLNLNAHVEAARVRNGELWHRVLVGPFDSRSKLAKARSVLVSNRLEALVLKRAPSKG